MRASRAPCFHHSPSARSRLPAAGRSRRRRACRGPRCADAPPEAARPSASRSCRLLRCWLTPHCPCAQSQSPGSALHSPGDFYLPIMLSPPLPWRVTPGHLLGWVMTYASDYQRWYCRSAMQHTCVTMTQMVYFSRSIWAVVQKFAIHARSWPTMVRCQHLTSCPGARPHAARCRRAP